MTESTTTTTTPGAGQNTPAPTGTPTSGAATAAPEAATPPAARADDGGKPAYRDPTGDEAARNVDREHAEADRTEGSKSNAGREAAKYRTQLRDVEAERDGLREQLAAFQRQAIDSIAEQAKIKPAALWASGAELGAMLNDDGTVNREAVEQAAESARESLGLARPTASARDAGITQGAGAPQPRKAGWADLLS